MTLNRPWVFEGYKALESDDLDGAEATFRAIAEAGEPRGWLGLGRTLLRRDQRDVDEILECFRQAAEGGAHSADFNYALLLLDPQLGIPRPGDAIPWLRRCAEEGRASIAASRLARMYRDGNGTEVDIAEAIRLYEWAIALENDPEAWLDLAALHVEQTAPNASVADAVRCGISGGLSAQRLSKGFPEEHRREYLDWINLSINLVRHQEAPLRDLAREGDPLAVYWLARALQAGYFESQPGDDPDALVALAAENEQPDACYQLAVLERERTEGGEPDLAESARLLQLAAENGQPDAAHDLGFSYLEGYGVEVDLEQALHWYRQAAKGHSQASMCDLAVGLLRRSESGTSPDAAADEAEALRWVTEAALRNDVRGMLMAAPLYRDGVGAKPNLVQAFRWFMRPMKFGNGDGLHEVHQFADQMTIEQLVEGDRLADGDESWVASLHAE